MSVGVLFFLLRLLQFTTMYYDYVLLVDVSVYYEDRLSFEHWDEKTQEVNVSGGEGCRGLAGGRDGLGRWHGERSGRSSKEGGLKSTG